MKLNELKTYCENRKNFKIDVEDLSLLEQDLLKTRTKIKDFKNVCKYHKTRSATEFSNYCRRCADPFRSHKKCCENKFA